jgi:hypothetical protein
MYFSIEELHTIHAYNFNFISIQNLMKFINPECSDYFGTSGRKKKIYG